MAFMDSVKQYTGAAMDYLRRTDTNSVKTFFTKRPEILGAAALAAYWAVMPAYMHKQPGHDHDRYCKSWEKYVDLGIAVIVPTLLDNIDENWHNRAIDMVVDLSISDGESRAKEKERTSREYLRRPEINGKIRKYSRLAVAYDILDMRIKDDVLLPKQAIPQGIGDPTETIPFGLFAGKKIDLGALLLTGMAGYELGGGLKAFKDPGRLKSMALFTAAELIYSHVPSVSLHVGDEIRKLARKHVDQVYKEAA